MKIDDMNSRMPFKVPDGYFADLKERLEAIPAGQESKELAGWQRLKPYVALAASFLVMVTGGTALLRSTAGSTEEVSSYERFQMADLLPVTDPYLMYDGYEPADSSEDISSDDIASYLIDSGTTLEHIEYYEENK